MKAMRHGEKKNELLNIAPVLIVFLVVLLGIVLPIENSDKKEAVEPPQTITRSLGHDLHFEIIPSPNDTFGYIILAGEDTLIRQPSIPALPGKEGFHNRKRARSVAKLVIKKIRAGIFPPTVTVAELDSLGIL